MPFESPHGGDMEAIRFEAGYIPRTSEKISQAGREKKQAELEREIFVRLAASVRNKQKK